jgi:ABC-type sugar transport system permease subunit
MAALILMSLWSVGQAVVIYLAALAADVPRPFSTRPRSRAWARCARFVHVVLPTIAPAVLFNAIIQTITAWQVFAAPYIMTEGGPDRSTYFYSHYVYDQAFVFQNMGYASALGWVQLLLLAGCIAVLYGAWRRLGATT